MSKKKEILLPFQAVMVAKSLLQDKYKEHFIAIYLNSRNKIIKTEVVSIGTLTSSIVHPREVFRPALVSRACGLIILHNHPSDDVSPSTDDIKVTEQLAKASKLLGIDLIDHIIFAKSNRFYSFKNKGLVEN